MSALSTVIYLNLIISVTALGIGILALFLPFNATSTTTTIVNANGEFSTIPQLALYDDRSQRVGGANQWTNVVFNTQLFTSSSWIHEIDADTIRCNRTALYEVYFGIQAQVNNTSPPSETPFACVACEMRYMIRAIQERVTNGEQNSILLEVPGSLTYANGESLFLSKTFFINAEIDDVFRFQFLSTCPQFTLHATPYLQQGVTPATVSSDLFPSSATLLIS